MSIIVPFLALSQSPSAHAGEAAPHARLLGSSVAPNAAIVFDVYTHGKAGLRVKAKKRKIAIVEVGAWDRLQMPTEGNNRYRLYRPKRGDWPAGATLEAKLRPDADTPWETVKIEVLAAPDRTPPVVAGDFVVSQEAKTVDTPISERQSYRFLHVAPVSAEGPLVHVRLTLVPAANPKATPAIWQTVVEPGQADIIPLPPSEPVCATRIDLTDLAGQTTTLTPTCR